MPSIAELEAAIDLSESAIVAFSGGVDSSLVSAVAARVLGDRALAVTAASPALATGELDGARAVARAVGIAHEVIDTDELAREGYRRNGPDRCYHCKSELYTQLAALAVTRGFEALFSGANVDDLGDWRPGLLAAAEHDVRHPLVEAGFGKAAVRGLAHELELPSADKPAMPCLASRLPFGTEVDPDILAQVDRAEQALKALGLRELRVRHLGTTGRVELGADDLRQALTEDRAMVVGAVLSAGYASVEIDTEPFESGKLTRGMRVQLPIVGMTADTAGGVPTSRRFTV